MKAIVNKARYMGLALLGLGVVISGGSLMAEAASAEPWSPDVAGEAVHYEPVFKDYRAMTHAPSTQIATGHEMSGHEMAGHEMAGHEMAGHEMAGHEMAGHEMAETPYMPAEPASHHHHH